MWIRVKFKNDYLINTANIGSIYLEENGLEVAVFSTPIGTHFNFENPKDAQAFFYGFQLALNGQDFAVCDERDGVEISWEIKPIKRSKQEKLYEYMMRLDMLADKT